MPPGSPATLTYFMFEGDHMLVPCPTIFTILGRGVRRKSYLHEIRDARLGLETLALVPRQK
jgi:hypothetical protein